MSKYDFLLRLVTVDKLWVHNYEPENKAQSCQWVGPGSPRPKKFNTQPSAGWLVACSWFNDPLRQFFSPYRAISQREGERGGEKG